MIQRNIIFNIGMLMKNVGELADGSLLDGTGTIRKKIGAIRSQLMVAEELCGEHEEMERGAAIQREEAQEKLRVEIDTLKDQREDAGLNKSDLHTIGG